MDEIVCMIIRIRKSIILKKLIHWFGVEKWIYVFMAYWVIILISCVKSVRIRSYSGPHFSRIFSHSDWIRSPYSVRCGKMRTRITPNTDTFYAVISWRTQMQFQMASFRNLFRALLAFTVFLYRVILEHLLLNCVSLNMNGGFCWFCNFHIYQQFLTQFFDDHQISFIIW